MASAGVIEGSTGRRASWIKATPSPVIEKRQAHIGAEVGEGHQDLLPANKSWPGPASWPQKEPAAPHTLTSDVWPPRM